MRLRFNTNTKIYFINGYLLLFANLSVWVFIPSFYTSFVSYTTAVFLGTLWAFDSKAFYTIFNPVWFVFLSVLIRTCLLVPANYTKFLPSICHTWKLAFITGNRLYPYTFVLPIRLRLLWWVIEACLAFVACFAHFICPTSAFCFRHHIGCRTGGTI